jgi:hypothetical protein
MPRETGGEVSPEPIELLTIRPHPPRRSLQHALHLISNLYRFPMSVSKS